MNELSLYSISTSLAEIINNDEIDEEQKAQATEILKEMIQTKSSDVIGLEKNMEYVIDAMKQEEERIKGNRKILENKLERYKEYIISCMNMLETKKIETPRGTITMVTNPMSVEIVDEERIPNKYKKEIIEIKIDKDKLKRDFKETGELVEGARFITDKTSLRFK